MVTSRNFTRDLGIQWGFLNQQTPQFGNTTNLAFPNAIVLNGQGVPSTGGIPADQSGLASRAPASGPRAAATRSTCPPPPSTAASGSPSATSSAASTSTSP